jgi:hypothetical protein
MLLDDKSGFVVKIIWKTQTHSAGIVKTSLMVEEVVYIVNIEVLKC